MKRKLFPILFLLAVVLLSGCLVNKDNYKELALGKTYELTNVTKHATYGDPENWWKLTDGYIGNKALGTIADVPRWFGAMPVDRSVDDLCAITIDLEKSQDIGIVRTQFGQMKSWGVRLPLSYTVQVSDDKENWSDPVTYEHETEEVEFLAKWFEVKVNQKGRYVKVTVKPYYTWFWMGEVSVRRP